MFSMQKIIVFALICAALWLGFRFVGNAARCQKMEERMAKPTLRERMRRSAGSPGSMRAREAAREPVAEVDMVPCRVCGDYVAAAGATSCGRKDCPYGTRA